MKIYVVWDNKEKKWFMSGSKIAWSKKQHAKNAVMNRYFSLNRKSVLKYFDRSELNDDWWNTKVWTRRNMSFADQTRYEVREYDITQCPYQIV